MTTAALTPHIIALQSRAARLREAITGCGVFFSAARQADPLATLSDLAGDWLHAEDVQITVPAGTAPLYLDDPGRLCGPVTIGRRIVGRIEARRSRPFDEDDRALIAALGQIVGAVLEQSTLLGQIEQYTSQARASGDALERLERFGRIVQGTIASPEGVALAVAAALPTLVGGERASVLLLPVTPDEPPALVLSNGTRSRPERAREVLAHGLAGMVLREGAPLIIDETDTDRRWLSLRLSQSDQRTRCAMAVPLRCGTQPLGALTVTTTESRLFGPAELSLLELGACHVALALRAASLAASQAARAARLAPLADALDAALAAAEAGSPGALATARSLAAQLRQLAGA